MSATDPTTGIKTKTSTDTISPLHAYVNESTQSIIDFIVAHGLGASFVWSNSSDRGAQTGMKVGDEGIQTDTMVRYRCVQISPSSIWQPLIECIDRQDAAVSLALTTAAQTAATFTYPALPFATKVEIDVELQTPNSTATARAVTAAFSLTGAGVAGAFDVTSVVSAASTTSNYGRWHGVVTIPANIAATVVVQYSCSATSAVSIAGNAHAKRYNG